MKFLKFMLALSLFASLSFAGEGRDLSIKLHLNAGAKAIRQWKRIFKKPKKMKRYGIDKLSPQEREALKEYLLNHAADSDHPEAAGL